MDVARIPRAGATTDPRLARAREVQDRRRGALQVLGRSMQRVGAPVPGRSERTPVSREHDVQSLLLVEEHLRGMAMEVVERALLYLLAPPRIEIDDHDTGVEVRRVGLESERAISLDAEPRG